MGCRYWGYEVKYHESRLNIDWKLTRDPLGHPRSVGDAQMSSKCGPDTAIQGISKSPQALSPALKGDNIRNYVQISLKRYNGYSACFLHSWSPGTTFWHLWTLYDAYWTISLSTDWKPEGGCGWSSVIFRSLCDKTRSSRHPWILGVGSSSS